MKRFSDDAVVLVVMSQTAKGREAAVESKATKPHAAASVSLAMVVVMAMMGTMCGSRLGAEAAIAENSFQYKEYWYRTEQLCPDLQEVVSAKEIDTANLPYKSVFRFMDHIQSVSEQYADLPCILESNGPKRLVSTALIEAIHVDNRPWNYSGARTCEEHIKLRLPEPTFLKRSNVPKIICRVPKSRNGLKEVTGSLYHPYVWQFPKGKLGLSFPSFNLSHLIQVQQLQQQQESLNIGFAGGNQSGTGGGGTDSPGEGNSTPGGKSYWLEPDPLGRQFVQIVFTTRLGADCTIRVQQYLIDPQKTLCGDIQTRSPFRLCGVYDCSEKEDILRTLGFWTHRKVHDQLDILLQSNLPRWRRDEPSYLEILVSTLRALIMPLLFLSVFYVTRRLRLKLASRHHPSTQGGRPAGGDRHRGILRQRQCYLRSLMRDGAAGTANNNNNNSSGSSDSSSGSAEQMLRPSLILNHVVYDIPVGGTGEYPVYEDLPPPYESIVQPPSYHVATTQVKQASSPSPPGVPIPPDEEGGGGGGEGVAVINMPSSNSSPTRVPLSTTTTTTTTVTSPGDVHNISPSSPTNNATAVSVPETGLSSPTSHQNNTVNNSSSCTLRLLDEVVFQVPADSPAPTNTPTVTSTSPPPSSSPRHTPA